MENPLLNGIEIIQTNPTPPPPANGDSLLSRSLDSSGNVGPTTTVDTATMDWTQIRGAFMVDNLAVLRKARRYVLEEVVERHHPGR